MFNVHGTFYCDKRCDSSSVNTHQWCSPSSCFSSCALTIDMFLPPVPLLPPLAFCFAYHSNTSVHLSLYKKKEEERKKERKTPAMQLSCFAGPQFMAHAHHTLSSPSVCIYQWIIHTQSKHNTTLHYTRRLTVRWLCESRVAHSHNLSHEHRAVISSHFVSVILC